MEHQWWEMDSPRRPKYCAAAVSALEHARRRRDASRKLKKRRRYLRVLHLLQIHFTSSDDVESRSQR